MELYPYLIDDFVIQFCHNLQKKDFTIKSEDFSTNKNGKRAYLNDSLTHNLAKALTSTSRLGLKFLELEGVRVRKSRR